MLNEIKRLFFHPGSEDGLGINVALRKWKRIYEKPLFSGNMIMGPPVLSLSHSLSLSFHRLSGSLSVLSLAPEVLLVR